MKKELLVDLAISASDMKPPINIEEPPGVKVPEDLQRKARRLEEDPEKILALVDLLFLGVEEERRPS